MFVRFNRPVYYLPLSDSLFISYWKWPVGERSIDQSPVELTPAGQETQQGTSLSRPIQAVPFF